MATLGTRPTVEIDPATPHEQRLEGARRSIEDNPSQMTSALARQYALAEAEVVGLLPADRAAPLDVGRWEQIIRGFEVLGDVHVIVTNDSTVLEVFGRFGGFSRTGPFFNVQSKSIDMHLRHETLASVFAVEKPGHMDGVSTLSVQFYNDRGAAALKVFLTFGGKAPAPERRAQWEAIRERYRAAG